MASYGFKYEQAYNSNSYNCNRGWGDYMGYSWPNTSNYEARQWAPPSYQAPIYQQEEPSVKEMVFKLLRRSEKYDQEVEKLKHDQLKLEEKQSQLAQTLSEIEAQIWRLSNAWEEEDERYISGPQESEIPMEICVNEQTDKESKEEFQFEEVVITHPLDVFDEATTI